MFNRPFQIRLDSFTALERERIANKFSRMGYMNTGNAFGIGRGYVFIPLTSNPGALLRRSVIRYSNKTSNVPVINARTIRNIFNLN